ncbi:MAG: phosphoribosylformylglycinamidine synthase [Bacteriovoracaceae bacterium]|nr:phosphoribosylformylglycinamidine synthase [Bacteriovoracaceae bacterium]
MSRHWAVVQFPGSNCDHDVLKVFQSLSKKYPEIEPVLHWHEDPIEKNVYEVIILPGGFSYGDYLRAGAIAKISQALNNLEEVIEAGAHVMGICNGFQILLETRLLPGYLQVNKSLKFISDTVSLKIEDEAFPWFTKKNKGEVVRYPIAHRFGNYQLSKIDKGEMKPVLKYQENPNGSIDGIAGVYRTLGKGSVFGLMPHPERAFFEDLRLTDGQPIWQNAVENLI